MDKENVPVKGINRAVGYSIEFEPDKTQAPVPKCVLEYSSKPVLSQQQLQERLELATLRRKHEEEARLARMQQREDATRKFDEKLRPFVNALAYAQAKKPDTE